MNKHRHSVKDYEYLLGRNTRIFYTPNISIYFKAMEITQEQDGRIMIGGIGVEGNYFSIPATHIMQQQHQERA